MRKQSLDEQENRRRFSEQQYEMLSRCSESKDMREWNDWRRANPEEDVLLEGADLHGKYLVGVLLDTGVLSEFKGRVNLENADFRKADLVDARFMTAWLKNAKFGQADLRNAKFENARLQGAIFFRANLQNAVLRTSISDGYTSFWKVKVDRRTDFRGVGLGGLRIDSGTKQLLTYNIRRKNWDEWYKQHPFLKWTIRTFWAVSDYGRSTGRIIASFFLLALIFAFTYWIFPGCVEGVRGGEDWRSLVHCVYFSVVTMTTLGFGDIAANPDSWQGQVLLMIQVILGYILLGALVTRFAVLFSVGGPAEKFAED